MSQRLQLLKGLQEVNLSPEEAGALLERLQTDRKTQGESMARINRRDMASRWSGTLQRRPSFTSSPAKPNGELWCKSRAATQPFRFVGGTTKAGIHHVSGDLFLLLNRDQCPW